MATLTGSNGALKFRGRKIARVRQFDISLNVDSLEDTCIGSASRTYVPGLFGASGTATILHDPADDGGREMLNTILRPQSNQDLEFILDEKSGTSLRAVGFLTSVSPSVAVGDVQASSVAFQISGPVDGSF